MDFETSEGRLRGRGSDLYRRAHGSLRGHQIPEGTNEIMRLIVTRDLPKG